MSSRDMIHSMNQFETSHSFDIGAYFSKMFNEYGIQTTIIVASIIAGLYLAMNGLAVLGFGMIFVVSFFVYIFTSYYDTQRSRGWPPTDETCPNGFYADASAGVGADVSCKDIYGAGQTFMYSPGDLTGACQSAKVKGYDWDRCGF